MALNEDDLRDLRVIAFRWDPLGIGAGEVEGVDEYDVLIIETIKLLEQGSNARAIAQVVEESVNEDWLGYRNEDAQIDQRSHAPTDGAIQFVSQVRNWLMGGPRHEAE